MNLTERAHHHVQEGPRGPWQVGRWLLLLAALALGLGVGCKAKREAEPSRSEDPLVAASMRTAREAIEAIEAEAERGEDVTTRCLALRSTLLPMIEGQDQGLVARIDSTCPRPAATRSHAPRKTRSSTN